MAYSTTLASVTEERIAAFRADFGQSLQASKIRSCSHYLVGTIWLQPLGGVVDAAIDGGEVLHARLRHPLRPPLVHGREAVTRLHAELTAAHEDAYRQETIPDDDWYEVQVRSLLDIYSWAAQRGEAVFSMLGPPYDETWAERGFIPRLT